MTAYRADDASEFASTAAPHPATAKVEKEVLKVRGCSSVSALLFGPNTAEILSLETEVTSAALEKGEIIKELEVGSTA